MGGGWRDEVKILGVENEQSIKSKQVDDERGGGGRWLRWMWW